MAVTPESFNKGLVQAGKVYAEARRDFFRELLAKKRKEAQLSAGEVQTLIEMWESVIAQAVKVLHG